MKCRIGKYIKSIKWKVDSLKNSTNWQVFGKIYQEKRESIYISKIGNKRGSIPTDFIEIKWIIREHYEQLYVSKIHITDATGQIPTKTWATKIDLRRRKSERKKDLLSHQGNTKKIWTDL